MHVIKNDFFPQKLNLKNFNNNNITNIEIRTFKISSTNSVFEGYIR